MIHQPIYDVLRANGECTSMSVTVVYEKKTKLDSVVFFPLLFFFIMIIVAGAGAVAVVGLLSFIVLNIYAQRK